MDEGIFVVGVGASAGGLTPLKAFVNSLPEDSDMAFIIVQHLDPTHESMLPEILSRSCKLPVKTAESHTPLEKNTVYVIPPDAYLEINNRTITLSNPNKERGFRKAIDHFFRSLASNCGTRCAAIVLSGSGSDGTAGLRAIKASGGLALVQQPEDAEHSSMPQSALDANAVDKSLPVDAMYPVLKKYDANPVLSNSIQKDRDSSEDKSLDKNIEAVALELSQHEGFNLTHYKTGTVQRRIARRMSLTTNNTYEDYLDLLKNSGKERKKLASELLINVTDFFRDPEAYQVLEEKVIPDILTNLKNGDDIRIWVAGCASGEEAYSIAILFLEALKARRMANDIRIFATDIDEDAIKIARRGVYPASIAAEVPDTYLERYFVKVDEECNFRIKAHVRELISFASQNIASDPPFNKMHLISCRNLLIYLNKDVQEKVLASFYFALQEGKYLFLGSAESLGNRGELFKTLDEKWRFYKKLPGGHVNDAVSMYLNTNKKAGFSEERQVTARKPPRASSRSDSIRRVILDSQVPATIVVNQDGGMLYNHGDLEPFCTLPKGEPKNDLMQVLRPSLRSRMRSALFKVRKSQQELSFQCSLTGGQAQDQKTLVRVKVVPVAEQDFADGTAYVISFIKEEQQTRSAESGWSQEDEGKADNELEQELMETKEELQNTIEELETSTEELKASHEETLSTNEELQSTNEELEASSEELRSLNEELSTVNAQLKDKIEELKVARDDVQNFFSSTDIPTLFLDTNLRIQRYTPAAELLLKLSPRDIDREIVSLGRDLVEDELVQDCKTVLQSFQPITKEIQDYKGRWFVRQATPYRTEDRRVDGVVLAFQEVTQLKTLSQRAESREAQQAVVAKLGLLALSGAHPENIMREAVRQVAHVMDAEYCKVLKYQPEENNLIMVAGIGWQSDIKIGETSVPADQGSQAGYTLQSQEPVIVDDINKEKRFTGPQLLIDHGVVSGISCLINHTEPAYGVLGVHTKSKRLFTNDDANFLQSVANMLSTAIRSRTAQEIISSSEERLNMACEAASIGIHDFDVKNNRAFWDTNHRKMWGVGTDEGPITFQTFQGGLHPEDKDRVVSEVSDALKKPGTYEWQFRVQASHDNAIRYINAKGHVIFSDGEAIRIVGTVQDISQQVSLEQSLQSAIDNLRENDMRKNQFLSILGHELRNPLAALTNGVDIVKTQLPENHRVVNVMKHGVDTMKNLLDDLLDLNRVSENRIELHRENVDLTQLLKDVVEQAQIQAAKKQLELKPVIAESLFVDGDPVRLEQIFINLVLNACKYTPVGGMITVSAHQSNGQALVEVSDNGIGIDESELGKVFDSFYQVKPDAEALQGLGIGLALVKNLVELHEGSVEARSDGVGQGAVFAVSLAAQKPPRGAKSADNGPAVNQQNDRRVLFIDDNVDMLMMMPDLLKSLKCTVDTARTGEEGIEKARSINPDVIILDIGLPKKSGHEVAATLRGEGYAGLIIALSGYSHQEARDKSREVGIDYHLAKPSTLKEINDVLVAGRP